MDVLLYFFFLQFVGKSSKFCFYLFNVFILRIFCSRALSTLSILKMLQMRCINRSSKHSMHVCQTGNSSVSILMIVFPFAFAQEKTEQLFILSFGVCRARSLFCGIEQHTHTHDTHTHRHGQHHDICYSFLCALLFNCNRKTWKQIYHKLHIFKAKHNKKRAKLVVMVDTYMQKNYMYTHTHTHCNKRVNLWKYVSGFSFSIFHFALGSKTCLGMQLEYSNKRL